MSLLHTLQQRSGKKIIKRLRLLLLQWSILKLLDLLTSCYTYQHRTTFNFAKYIKT